MELSLLIYDLKKIILDYPGRSPVIIRPLHVEEGSTKVNVSKVSTVRSQVLGSSNQSKSVKTDWI